MMSKHTLYTVLIAIVLNITGYFLLNALNLNSTYARYGLYAITAVAAWLIAAKLTTPKPPSQRSDSSPQ